LTICCGKSIKRWLRRWADASATALLVEEFAAAGSKRAKKAQGAEEFLKHDKLYA
jgi:hypothetical protein